MPDAPPFYSCPRCRAAVPSAARACPRCALSMDAATIQAQAVINASSPPMRPAPDLVKIGCLYIPGALAFLAIVIFLAWFFWGVWMVGQH